MPIIQYPGYLTKEEAALRKKVQVRAINAHIRNKTVTALKIDGLVFIKDNTSTVPSPPGIALNSLEWVYRFARRHKMTSDLIYEQIVLGNISGVIVADRIFVINTEASLLSFLTANRKN